MNATMKIRFHPLDDVSEENRNRFEGHVITTTEAKSAKWKKRYHIGTFDGWEVSFATERSLIDVLKGLEFECYNLDELKEINYIPH